MGGGGVTEERIGEGGEEEAEGCKMENGGFAERGR